MSESEREIETQQPKVIDEPNTTTDQTETAATTADEDTTDTPQADTAQEEYVH